MPDKEESYKDILGEIQVPKTAPLDRSFTGGMKAAATQAGKGFAAGTMASAFESFGKAFTRTGDVAGDRASEEQRMAPWREQGAKVNNALEVRWQQMEFENFKEETVNQYLDNKKQLVGSFKKFAALLDDKQWIDPTTGEPIHLDDTTEQGRHRLLQYRNRLFTEFSNKNIDLDMGLSNSAYKYPNNPMVQKVIESMMQGTSKQLDTVANPEQSLKGQKAVSDIEVQERNSRANMLQARSQAKASKTKDPTSIRQALKHADIGVEGVLEWMTAGGGAALLHSAAGTPFVDTAFAKYRQHLIDNEGFEDDGPGGEGTQTLDNKMKESGQTINNIAAVEMLRSVDPRAAKAAKAYAPQFFAHELSGEDQPKGVIKGTRLSKQDTKENIKAWEGELDKQLTDYMSDLSNETDIESAIEYLINEWLPKAIVGDTDDKIDSKILATESTSTLKYRNEVKAALEKYIRRHWGKISSIAKEENPELFKRERNIRASQALRRSRGRGPRRGIK